MNKNYKYRANLNYEQISVLRQWRLSSWEIMRWAVKQRRWAEHQNRRAYQAWVVSTACIGVSVPDDWFEEPKITKYSQSRELTKKRDDNPDWKAVPRHTCNPLLERVEQGQKKVWDERKAGNHSAKLRYPDKPEDVSLPFPDGIIAFRQVSRRYASVVIHNAKKTLGEVRFRYHRPLPEDAEVKTITLKEEVDGWYIILSCAFEASQPLSPTGETIGVDLNCQHYGDTQAVAAISDGRVYYQDDDLKRMQQKLGHLQRLASPRKVHSNAKAADPDSNRTKKRRRRIARLHQKIARKRAERQRFIAKRIASTADIVVFEKINWKALRRVKKKDGTRHKRGGRQLKRNLNKSMSTAAPGQLRQFTREKCNEYGREYHEVNAAYTSQACSACGEIPSQKKDLSVRSWVCPGCGAEHHRDVNAAKNIARRVQQCVEVSAPVCNGEVPGEGERIASSSANLEGGGSPTVREDEASPQTHGIQPIENRSCNQSQKKKKAIPKPETPTVQKRTTRTDAKAKKPDRDNEQLARYHQQIMLLELKP